MPYSSVQHSLIKSYGVWILISRLATYVAYSKTLKIIAKMKTQRHRNTKQTQSYIRTLKTEKRTQKYYNSRHNIQLQNNNQYVPSMTHSTSSVAPM